MYCISSVAFVLTLIFIAVPPASADEESGRDMFSDSLFFGNSTGNETIPDLRISVSPSLSVHMLMGDATLVNVTYVMFCRSPHTVYKLHVYVADSDVAFTTESGEFLLSCSNTTDASSSSHALQNETILTGQLNITLKAELIGRTWLIFETEAINETMTDKGEFADDTIIEEEYNQEHYDIGKYLIVVIRQTKPIDTIFRVLVYFFLVISTIGMGCKMKLEVVWAVLKKPIAPAIGFCCQYLFMPMIAFGVAKVIPFNNPAVALGIFASGICPGGGASNIYSYLLGGDVSLSITMTTISNIGALGMIPLWMFTLGQQFKDDKIQITIPYLDIIQTLATVILPLFVGIFIKYKCLKVADFIKKILKPVTFVTIAVVLACGIYANLYIFRLFKPSTFLAGCLLPYVGYISGGLTGLIFRQPWKRVKTIAIETGIQNTMVAYIMLLTALPPPDGDLAAVGPVASAVMTPIPLFLIAIVYNVYLKCIKKDYGKVSKSEEGGNNTTENGNVEINGSNNIVKSKKRNKKSDGKRKGENGEIKDGLVDDVV